MIPSLGMSTAGGAAGRLLPGEAGGRLAGSNGFIVREPAERCKRLLAAAVIWQPPVTSCALSVSSTVADSGRLGLSGDRLYFKVRYEEQINDVHYIVGLENDG